MADDTSYFLTLTKRELAISLDCIKGNNRINTQKLYKNFIDDELLAAVGLDLPEFKKKIYFTAKQSRAIREYFLREYNKVIA